MPYFSAGVDINVTIEDFVADCNKEEKEELKKLLGDTETEMCALEDLSLSYFAGKFDLKRFFQLIGKEECSRVLSKL